MCASASLILQLHARVSTGATDSAINLTPQQMQQRKGLSTDFQCLKARGYKPFFSGPTLKYRDGPVVRKCARGEAAQAATFPPVRQPRPQRNSVAIDLTEVLHQSGVTIIDRTLGSLAAAEAEASNDLVGGLGTSDVGI